ncbi:MAG: hypothetical protein QG656_851, partial [Candidatus Hydrogenedentes bacterium]|nr:hypothetical protein [Candidatus Hydrogenedentota bacterium]
MKKTSFLFLTSILIAAGAMAEMPLLAPGMPPSQVVPDGGIVEDWGAINLQLTAPEGAQVAQQTYDASGAPTAVTVKTAGPVTLTETAYRAPIWPDGVDVLEAVISNNGDTPQPATVEMVLPDGASIGERVAALGGRTILAL